MIAAGIDCASGGSALTYAALDSELRVLSLTHLEADELLRALENSDVRAVAINSPSALNAGYVRRRLHPKTDTSVSTRGTELREAEFELHARGILVGATPRMEALAPAWVRFGLGLYRGVENIGFHAFRTEEGRRQWLETHPHAGFCALLGRQPLPKPTLEGRLQRALILFERGVRITDPMSLLEEITRHRLLHGIIPLDQVPTQEQLDALLAAYTAWLAMNKPGEVSQVGNTEEGFVTLPVPQLLATYTLT